VKEASLRMFTFVRATRKPNFGFMICRLLLMRDFPRTNSGISLAIQSSMATRCKRPGMSTLEIDVGDLRPRSVEFTADDLVVTLADGRKITTPLDWYPRLKRASSKERANFEIMPMGIHWPDLDEDLGIAGMLKGRRAQHGRDET
jgi:hypothetical protein